MPDDGGEGTAGAGGGSGAGGGGSGSAQAGGDPSARRVRPTQDQLWQSKALAAQERLADLERKLADAELALQQARASLDAGDRARAIDRELVAAGAVDLETASMLLESTLAGGGDVVSAVADLKQRKPFLFRARLATGGAMAPASVASAPGLDAAATEARQSGDRAAVLRYLRMKRGA